MEWRDGRNPFDLPSRREMLAHHTTKLPKAAKELQWVVSADDREHSDPTRGSAAVAAHGGRPPWLTKPQFEARGALRADPGLELRSLCAALRERSLPLKHEAVHLVVRQLLYAVGPLQPGRAGCFPAPGASSSDLPQEYLRSVLGSSATEMRWKSELAVRGRGSLIETLHEELSGLAEELRDRVSEHAALVPVIDAAVYLSRWRADRPAAADTDTDPRWACVGVVERRAPPPN